MQPIINQTYKNGANYCNGAGPTCGYILSGSTRYLKTNTKGEKPFDTASGLPLNEYISQASWNISMEVPINKDNANKINYTTDTTIYKKSKEYINYDGESSKMLKYENTPEYFACLPLIKI